MPQVKKYKAEVISIINPVDNIYTVEFKSHSGQFKFLPGQFLHLALDEYDPSQGWPESRCFSIQSSPGNELLKFTFAVKGSFTKRIVNELRIGKILNIKLPYGELFQQEHSKDKVVFIAGGTGVTPYLSMLTNSNFISYTKPILYLGLREKRFNVYESELDLAQKINSSLKIFIKYDGILDIESIFKENGISSTYFISGPPEMISIFKEKLLIAGVSINNIKVDEWE